MLVPILEWSLSFSFFFFFQGCITVCFSDYSTVTLPLSSSSKYLVYITFCLTQFRSLCFSGVLVHVCYLLLLLCSLCIYASLCFIVLFPVSYVHIQVSIVFFGYFSILFWRSVSVVSCICFTSCLSFPNCFQLLLISFTSVSSITCLTSSNQFFAHLYCMLALCSLSWSVMFPLVQPPGLFEFWIFCYC